MIGEKNIMNQVCEIYLNKIYIFDTVADGEIIEVVFRNVAIEVIEKIAKEYKAKLYPPSSALSYYWAIIKIGTVAVTFRGKELKKVTTFEFVES